MGEIAKRLDEVRRRIEEARSRSRYGQAVTLVAVTKFHPLEAMEEAIRAGAADVGENRVQEMEGKHAELTLPVTWHLIGHLQKNKVKKAVAISDLIQSVDTVEIMKDIDRRAGEIGKVQDILLEFNIAGEESKSGFPPAALDEAARAALSLSHIRVRGLMCMAPIEDDAEKTRPVFREARALWEKLPEYFPKDQITVLSMGMTQDFETAIEEGSTMVRVGTAIFGARPAKEGA